MCKFSRLETETEILQMPETRLRRDSRLVSSRKVVETESLADPCTALSPTITLQCTTLNKNSTARRTLKKCSLVGRVLLIQSRNSKERWTVRLFFCAFWQKLDFFKNPKTRFLPKTRFQKSKNSILGHKLASKTPQILPFPGKSCLQKVRKTNFAQKINEKHKITSKFGPKAQKLDFCQKLDSKSQKTRF